MLATYVVVLPITINPAKYIPPAFASRMQQDINVAATALPPIPESMPDLDEDGVRRLADARADDVLDGGVIAADPERLMMVTHEIANEYAAVYRQSIEQRLAPAANAAGASSQPGEPVDDDEVSWLLMSERERIGELAKLTGQLRHAVEGDDARLRAHTEAKVERLGRHLPEKYRIAEFLRAAAQPGETGRKLAELYVDRCYKLGNEQYETLAQIDRDIAALEAGR